VDRALKSIRNADHSYEIENDNCCNLPSGLGNTFSWAFGSRRGCEPLDQTVFEDHDGTSITFREFFRGHPSIVVFFYTRCDNPLKCSLTITKLARIQKLLESGGLAAQIQTAAISYDPAYDLPKRLRVYGQDRGVRLDPGNRMLRTVNGGDTLRRHFRLGVNFIESLVNRHRLEVYILDSEGRIAASFERIHWDEQQVVARAIAVLHERNDEAKSESEITRLPNHAVGSDQPAPQARPKTASPVFGTLASLGVAFFPKCPVCWAGYMSMLGIASLEQIPYSPWLQPVLVAVMLINLASVWARGRATGRRSAFYLVSAGALAILISRRGPAFEKAAVWGVALTFGGSLLSALNSRNHRSLTKEFLAKNWRERFSVIRLGWILPPSSSSKSTKPPSTS
jgi:protein SCO1/2